MANPQKENGYTAIANEILDALIKYSPGGSQAQVFLVVIRKTYGFHKKEDLISISQLSEATKLSKRAVIYAIQNLEAKKMITVNRSSEDGKKTINSISIQKDHEQWIPDAESKEYSEMLTQKRNKYQSQVVQRNIQISAPSNNEVSSAEKATLVVQRNEENMQISAHTKEKRNIQKKIYLLPAFIKPETWDAFLEMRKKQKATPTVYAIELLINKLTTFKEQGQDPNEVLNQSIENNWKGLFPLKNNQNKTQESDTW